MSRVLYLIIVDSMYGGENPTEIAFKDLESAQEYCRESNRYISETRSGYYYKEVQSYSTIKDFAENNIINYITSSAQCVDQATTKSVTEKWLNWGKE